MMNLDELSRVPDPTYDWAVIVENPVWRMAYQLSELFNDGAPIGWSLFIPIAQRTTDECRALTRGPGDAT